MKRKLMRNFCNWEMKCGTCTAPPIVAEMLFFKSFGRVGNGAKVPSFKNNVPSTKIVIGASPSIDSSR